MKTCKICKRCNKKLLVPAWKLCNECTAPRSRTRKLDRSEHTRRMLTEEQYRMLVTLVENGVPMPLIHIALGTRRLKTHLAPLKYRDGIIH